MIDWISIVRHSRRRFSGFSARSPVRIPRRPKKHQMSSVPQSLVSPIKTSSKDDCRVSDSPTVSTKSSKQSRLHYKTQSQIISSCCNSPFCVNNQPIKVSDTDGNVLKREQQQTDATAITDIQQQQNNGRQLLSGNSDVNIVSPYEVYMLF